MKQTSLFVILWLAVIVIAAPEPAVSAAKTEGNLVSLNITNAELTTVPAPASYQESPMMTERVKAGKLPPVEERLPDEPLVLQVPKIGKHGGTLRRAHLGPQDAHCNVGRVTGRGPFRFSGDGKGVVPAALKSYEANADHTVYTVHLLKGMKWSDGVPFTADDWVFQYEDVLMNKALKTPPPWIKVTGDPPVQVVKVDDYTVEFRYAQPWYFFELNMGGCCCTSSALPFAPKHYLKQFHIKYNPQAQEQAKAAGFDTWERYYLNRHDARDNPDLPNVGPWIWRNTRADAVINLERNPYYPMVDQDGNQLPYIDYLRYESVENVEVLNLKAVQGEIDFQARHMSFASFTTLKENEAKGGYTVRLVPDPHGGDIIVYFNLSYQGPEKVLIGNQEFRIALSEAVDREAINEITGAGMGVIRNALPTADHPYYPGPEYETKYATYQPEKSRKTLSKLMGPPDSEGYLTMPDGSRFEFIISTTAAMGAWPDGAEQVCEYWKKVGVRCRPDVLERGLLQTRTTANEHMARIHNADGDVEMFVWAGHVLPVSHAGYGWANGWTSWYLSGGEAGVEPPDDVKHLQQIYDSAGTKTPEEQTAIAREIFRYNIDHMTRLNLFSKSGMVSGIVVTKNNVMNVPEWWANRAILNMPFNSFPDQFWFRK